MPARYGQVFTPLHKQVDSRRLEQFGSGLLLSIDGKFVLISAGHVFAELNNSHVWLPGAPAFFPVTGEIVSSAGLEKAGRTDDLLDLGFTFLDDFSQGRLRAAGLDFLPIQSVDLNGQSLLSGRCIFSGFPSSKSDAHVGASRIASTPTHIRCPVLDDAQTEALGFKPRIQVVARYNRIRQRDDESGRVIQGPLPFGMSGGPVWGVQIDGTPMLVAIGVFYDEVRNLLVGTKIHFAIKEIVRRMLL